jgi:hypothetical protein
MKEGVFLGDNLYLRIADGLDPSLEIGQVGHARFDFNIAWHQANYPA